MKDPKTEQQRMAKYEAVLRRLCQPKKKGISVPEDVYKAWKKGGDSRRGLLQMMVKCKGDKARGSTIDAFSMCNTS